MFRIIFLSLSICWSTIQADYPQNAFETICVPHQACYYVSKFKTSWEEAQQMCQEKVQQHSSSFNEADNAILNPLSDNLLTRRYWVMEPTDQNFQQGPQVTVILNRNKRSITVDKAQIWKGIDFRNVTDEYRLRLRINAIINKIIERIRLNRTDELDINCLNKFKGLIESNQTSLTQETIIDEVNKYIKIFNEWNVVELVKKAYDWERDEVIREINYIIKLVNDKQTKELNLDTLERLRVIFDLLKPFKPIDKTTEKPNEKPDEKTPEKPKEKPDEKTPEKPDEKTPEKPKEKPDEKTPEKPDEKTPEKPKEKPDEKTPEKPDEKTPEKPKEKPDEKTPDKPEEKPEVEGNQKIITSIKLSRELIRLNWTDLVNYLDQNKRQEIIEKINTFITTVEKKRYDLIDENALKTITEIVITLTKIKEVPDMGKLIPKKNITEITEKSTKDINLLIELNWEELVKYIDPVKRPQVIEKIKTFITLVQNKQFEKIEPDFINFITQIITSLQTIRKINEQNKITEAKNLKIVTENSIKNVEILTQLKWEELIKFFEEKSRPLVVDKIKTFINLVTNKQFEKIDNPLTEFVVDVIKKLEKAREVPTIEKPIENEGDKKVIIEKSQTHLKTLIDLKWPELVEYIEESNRPEVVKKINTFITLVKNKEFDKIDSFLFNWVTKIISTFKQVQEISVKDKANKEKIRLTITETSPKYVEYLTELKWEEQVKLLDEKKRPEIIEKIKLFLTLVKEKQFEKIDTTLFNWITDTITTLKKVKIVPEIDVITKEKNKKEIVDTSTKYTKFLVELNWPDLLKYIDEKSRPEVENKLKVFVTLVNNKEFDKIDVNFINSITQIITVLRKAREINISNRETEDRNRKAIVEISTKNIDALNELKWEELVKHIDDKSRPEIVKKIKTLITLITNKEYDKIDSNLLNWISQIVIVLKKVKEINVNNEITEKNNRQIITTASINYIKILNEINWPELVQFIEEKSRPEVINKLKTFTEYVQNKQFDKIDTNLINWITEIITTLRRVKEINDTNKETAAKNRKIVTDLSVKYIELLNELKWPDLVKYIDPSNRPDVIEKINTFQTLVKNKDFDKIDNYLLSWMKEIIVTLRKVHEINVRNNVAAETNKQIIRTTSVNYFNLLNELKWQEVIKHIEDKSRPQIEQRIKEFLINVEKQQFDTITVDLLNWIGQLITIFRKIRVSNFENRRTELLSKVQITLPGNWIELVKRIKGIDQNLWISRIQYLLTMSSTGGSKNMDINWIEDLQKIIQLISQEYIVFKKENFLNEETTTKIRQSVKSLQEWNWKNLLQYIDIKNRRQVETDVTEMISASVSGNFEKLDVQIVRWFFQIFQIFTQINDAIKDGYEYDATTKTWVKQIVTKRNYRQKRSIDYNDEVATAARFNVDLIHETIAKLQRALSYNQMLLGNTKNDSPSQSRLCPFINKVDEKLMTKMTNCGIKQRFICKKQLN